MYESRIAALCAAAASGSLDRSLHYDQRQWVRPTPDGTEILFILCDDEPQIIEDYPTDPRGSCCLIWGTTSSGRIGHLVCGYSPGYRVITAYFPADTQPDRWEDNYRRRKPIRGEPQ